MNMQINTKQYIFLNIWHIVEIISFQAYCVYFSQFLPLFKLHFECFFFNSFKTVQFGNSLLQNHKLIFFVNFKKIPNSGISATP